MVEETTPITGGCLCGAVRFRITAKPLAAHYCHCTMCQKQTGGPVGVFATVPSEGFSFTKDEPAAYESSPGSLRLFCGACGSPMGARGHSAETPTFPVTRDIGGACFAVESRNGKLDPRERRNCP